MTVSTRTQELYGGAIESTVPEGFIDLSDLREVPDTQEVFVTMEDGADESQIFDLLERMDASSDTEALAKHIAEQAALNESAENSSIVYVHQLAGTEYPSYISIAVSAARKWGRESDKEVKPVLLVVNGLIRLEKVETDVLITFNMPTETDETSLEMARIVEELSTQSLPLSAWNHVGNYGINQRIDRALEMVQAAQTQFKVKDWGLFA